MRLLARYRLSRTTEASTSFERQEEACEAYAKIHGHEIVDKAIDPDVSGSLSPFDTPEFGEKLRNPDDFDGVIAWKLDRLGRTLFGLNDLFRWAQDNGKTLISVEDNIDLSTWVGRLVASVIAGVAEGELEAIKLRTRASQRYLRDRGRWHGGKPPYGYEAVKKDDGWYLEPHPVQADVVRDIFDRIAAGESLRSVGLSLTSSAPRGGAWTVSTLRQMIRARWPLGEVWHNGRPVLGDDGMVRLWSEPLVSHDTWTTAQQALSKRTKTRTRHHDVGMLLDVAYCDGCGSKLYLWAHTQKGKTYGYWRCGERLKGSGCSVTPIAANELEPWVTNEFLSKCGSAEEVERTYVEGSDTSALRSRLDDAIATARREKDLGLYEGDEANYLARLTELIERRRELPNDDSPSRWVSRGTGKTYGELFVKGDGPTRRALLVTAGVTVKARPGKFTMNIPDDLFEHLPGKTFGLPDGLTVQEAEYWDTLASAPDGDLNAGGQDRPGLP